jgi:hypothetical protein
MLVPDKTVARWREGALGEDADALVSLQRLVALAGLTVGGAASWDALLALSLTKVRFTGRDSIKLDREEEDMIDCIVLISCGR